MRLLVFSTLYPNAAAPSHGVFVENRLRAFLNRHDTDVRVVAPIPWFPVNHSLFGRYARYARAPLHEVRHGIKVSHPRYLVVPKLAMTTSPDALSAVLRKELDRLANEGWKPDLIDAHYFYPDGIAATRIGKERAIPVVVTARGTDVNLLPEYDGPRALIRQAACDADAIITVAQALKNALIALDVPSEKITTLRNGVDLELFSPGNRDGERATFGVGGTVIASVGQLIERKGNHLIIDALASLKDVTLLLAGDGAERGALERQAQTLGVSDRIKFLGAVRHEDLPRIYRAADALVLASSREGWPNVLLEAMACGTPCVATNVWGNAEVISSPAAGRLCDARTSDAIGKAVTALLQDPPARADVRAHAQMHRWDETVDGMSAIFNQLKAKSDRMTNTTSTPITAVNSPPKLIVTIDTEEQFDWARFDPEGYTLADVKDIDRFQSLCEAENVSPLYFLSFPLIMDAPSARYYREKQNAGLAACGLHLHPWVTPPHSALKGEYYSYQMNYPDNEHRTKLAALADAYENIFGARASAHRAGRYGIAPDNYAFLAEIGITHDFSPSPAFDFSATAGPDFSGTSNKAFVAHTPAGPVAVTPVCGARALRHTKVFRSQELSPAGFGQPKTRAPFTEPVRITPEASDLETLKALTTRLVSDGTGVLTFTIHSTSLTIGATDYSADAATVDRMLKITQKYFQWFRQSLGGNIVSLNELATHYEKSTQDPRP